VVVKDNRIIATGYHWGPGHDHAEVAALKQLSPEDACQATMFVTLEPCCHWGKTPPCTEALIKARIKKVIYGFEDSNPLVAGKGVLQLRDAGIVCEHRVLPEVNAFYASYQHWHRTKRPFVTAKIALTLDGKIAGPEGNPIAITSAPLNKRTHESRLQADAILTTAKTVIADDPQLNVRLPDQVIAKPIYILDGHLQTPRHARIFRTAKTVTLFHAPSACPTRVSQWLAEGVRCVEVPSTSTKLDLPYIMAWIGQDGMHDLWVEAGGYCFSALLRANLLQRALIYQSLKWCGVGQNAFADDFSWDIKDCTLSWQQVGPDVVCEINWSF